MSRPSDAFAFFLEHAGYGYVPGEETEQEGKERCARVLADAEKRGTDLGLEIEFSPDPDADASFMDTEDYDDDDRYSAEFVCALVRDAEGEIVASLGSIHEDARDRQGARNYRRVIRAELFSEALPKQVPT